MDQSVNSRFHRDRKKMRSTTGQVSGAGLVTLLSGGASTGGSATFGRPVLQPTGEPHHPANHALEALSAPCAYSCSSVPCLLVRGQAMLCHGFHATSKTVGQTAPPCLAGMGRLGWRPRGVGKSARSPSREAG